MAETHTEIIVISREESPTSFFSTQERTPSINSFGVGKPAEHLLQNGHYDAKFQHKFVDQLSPTKSAMSRTFTADADVSNSPSPPSSRAVSPTPSSSLRTSDDFVRNLDAASVTSAEPDSPSHLSHNHHSSTKPRKPHVGTPPKPTARDQTLLRSPTVIPSAHHPAHPEEAVAQTPSSFIFPRPPASLSTVNSINESEIARNTSQTSISRPRSVTQSTPTKIHAAITAPLEVPVQQIPSRSSTLLTPSTSRPNTLTGGGSLRAKLSKSLISSPSRLSTRGSTTSSIKRLTPIVLTPDTVSSYTPKRFGLLADPSIVVAVDAFAYHATPQRPVDPYWLPRWNMAHMHLAGWLGLEGVCDYADNCEGDVLAFCKYGEAVVHAIETHHDIEEEYYFPLLSSRINMQGNLEQHAAFDEGLRALKFYFKACNANTMGYSAAKVLELMAAFALTLANHFADELDTLSPDLLREAFSLEDLERQGQILEKEVAKDAKRNVDALPCLLVNVAPHMDWPSLTMIQRRIWIPLILGAKNKGSWKYGRYPNRMKVWSRSR